jgi:hypothetical protein
VPEDLFQDFGGPVGPAQVLTWAIGVEAAGEEDGKGERVEALLSLKKSVPDGNSPDGTCWPVF